MAEPEPTITGRQWTKDSVEHARGLHTALVTISAGLILLVASAKSYRPTALTQIAEIVQLKQHWSPEWIWQHRPAPWRNDSSVELSGLDRQNPPEISPGVIWYSVVKIAAVMTATVYQSKNSVLKPDQQFELSMPDDLWLTQSVHGFLVQKDDPALLSDPISIYSFPENLNQFENWWNALEPGRLVLHPETLSGLATMVDGSDQTIAKLAVISRAEYRGKPRVLRRLKLSTQFKAGVPLGDQVSYQAYDPATNLTIMIPLGESISFRLDQNYLSYFFHWSKGTYESTFSDLIKATKGQEYVPLEELQKNLVGDAAKGPETFEAFGLKLPAEQITAAGIILLLAIQLYLLLCFRQRAAGIAAADSVWDVPWIALDQSRFGRSVFLVSLALPSLAIGILAGNAMPHLIGVESGWTWKPWNWPSMVTHNRLFFSAEVALFVAAIVASTSVGAACWRNRPQVVTEPKTRRV